MKRALALLSFIAIVGAAGAVPARAAKRPKLMGSITVSAAASLTEAFTKMGAHFQKLNKGTTVTFNFSASSTLAQQIQGGAPADVFASADRANMQELVSGGQVTSEPIDLAANLLTIVVKPGNPKGVESLADLPGVGIVSLCAATAPCGKYAAQALSQDGITLPVDKVTLGQDPKATLAAVATGDADAGIVYVTDARSAGKSVHSVRIPASLNVLAVYPIARLASSRNARLANAWVKYVMSAPGQTRLQSFGFLPAPTAA
ncbi:MAG: molybdate ABC transporter substrate-binding protein [Acidimicrobiia bacterium]